VVALAIPGRGSIRAAVSTVTRSDGAPAPDLAA
jgi:hypothetical protein